jgi:hypothetical protein
MGMEGAIKWLIPVQHSNVQYINVRFSDVRYDDLSL